MLGARGRLGAGGSGCALPPAWREVNVPTDVARPPALLTLACAKAALGRENAAEVAAQAATALEEQRAKWVGWGADPEPLAFLDEDIADARRLAGLAAVNPGPATS